jgi:hypothetical protein
MVSTRANTYPVERTTSYNGESSRSQNISTSFIKTEDVNMGEEAPPSSAPFASNFSGSCSQSPNGSQRYHRCCSCDATKFYDPTCSITKENCPCGCHPIAPRSSLSPSLPLPYDPSTQLPPRLNFFPERDSSPTRFELHRQEPFNPSYEDLEARPCPDFTLPKPWPRKILTPRRLSKSRRVKTNRFTSCRPQGYNRLSNPNPKRRRNSTFEPTSEILLCPSSTRLAAAISCPFHGPVDSLLASELADVYIAGFHRKPFEFNPLESKCDFRHLIDIWETGCRDRSLGIGDYSRRERSTELYPPATLAERMLTPMLRSPRRKWDSQHPSSNILDSSRPYCYNPGSRSPPPINKGLAGYFDSNGLAGLPDKSHRNLAGTFDTDYRARARDHIAPAHKHLPSADIPRRPGEISRVNPRGEFTPIQGDCQEPNCYLTAAWNDRVPFLRAALFGDMGAPWGSMDHKRWELEPGELGFLTLPSGRVVPRIGGSSLFPPGRFRPSQMTAEEAQIQSLLGSCRGGRFGSDLCGCDVCERASVPMPQFAPGGHWKNGFFVGTYTRA